jgi:hypothetical protein
LTILSSTRRPIIIFINWHCSGSAVSSSLMSGPWSLFQHQSTWLALSKQNKKLSHETMMYHGSGDN